MYKDSSTTILEVQRTPVIKKKTKMYKGHKQIIHKSRIKSINIKKILLHTNKYIQSKAANNIIYDLANWIKFF